MSVDMRKLYRRVTLADGQHRYLPPVAGRHNLHVFRRAEEAQAHSEQVPEVA